MSQKTRNLVAITVCVGVTAGSTGCSKALGLQDWQRDLLGTAANLIGGFLAGQSTRVVVERQCFENGVEVDCSSIPGG